MTSDLKFDESPRDDFAVTEEFAREILGGIEREPYRRVGALGDVALGVRAAHIGSDPAGTHRIDSD